MDYFTISQGFARDVIRSLRACAVESSLANSLAESVEARLAVAVDTFERVIFPISLAESALALLDACETTNAELVAFQLRAVINTDLHIGVADEQAA